MNEQNKSDVVLYNDGELELNVSINDETVWLNRNQISELFGRDVKTIGKHVSNVFSDGELEKNSTVAKFATVQNEGGREVRRDVEYYNLDVIISVGYRVKSQKGVRFRQWATSVLKGYISDGYVINSEKITHERFKELENVVAFLKLKVENISSLIKDNSMKPSKGIFFDGEIYDAYVFVNNLLKSAKNEIVLIDNYIDEGVFTLFSKYPNLKIIIYSHTITKQLKLDYQKYKSQYKNIELKEFKNAHDRFMIIDNTEIYHIGASIKDLGKKWFAFSKFEMSALELLERLK
ncbi:MAG: DNA-binding protein [Sulfurimonas sp.]|nr:DNA-binding protein [Sulfurimonas sp.]MBU3939031.1 virulence RhuM family protein [bacterium]MBU4025604.1 virulence RhuM family protein [bacterium]MBU4059642.1 virulence RhuM family protein [bacterium]MBU4111095.1 virulence RhuM family protein [bacterium]